MAATRPETISSWRLFSRGLRWPQAEHDTVDFGRLGLADG
jgi:hypothetical protein